MEKYGKSPLNIHQIPALSISFVGVSFGVAIGLAVLATGKRIFLSLEEVTKILLTGPLTVYIGP